MEEKLIKVGWVALVTAILITAWNSVFSTEKPWIGLLAITFGIFILGVGYYCLVSVLPKKAKEKDTSISIIALRASFWLVIGGIVIIFLGFLYLMGVIPPLGWEKAKEPSTDLLYQLFSE